MKLLFILLVLLTSAEANAFWSPAEQKWYSNFCTEKPIFSDGYASTVWGALGRGSVDPSSDPDENVPYFEAMVESDDFRTGNLEGNMLLQTSPDDEDTKLKAPLIILLPGIFNSADTQATANTAEVFWRKGYHVVALPNPWSARYIRHKPKNMPGDLTSESQVALNLIHKMIEKIGRENITTVSMLGESYGAILGAATYATDFRSNDPVFDGKILLMSPPLNLGDGSKRLDEGIERTEPRYSDCATLSMAWTIFKTLMSDPSITQDKLNARTMGCMEPLVFRTFRNSLTESYGAMKSSLINEKDDDDYMPDPDAEGLATPSTKGMRFSKTFKDIMPQNIPLLESRTENLSYWTNQLSGTALSRLHIVSAKDDLLNAGKTWTMDESPAFSPRTTFLLSWGGHLGFMASPEYKKLIDLMF